MKLHIGCGQTILPDYINIDNSPSLRLVNVPQFALNGLRKLRLLNEDQLTFIKFLKGHKQHLRFANCMELPFEDNSVDVCYSAHMIGWCLSHQQLLSFFHELKRVLKPGGVLRLSFFDFDQLVNDYLQHKSTIAFSRHLPLGTTDFTFREKFKFLLSPNMHNGLVLNRETIVQLLDEVGFCSITLLRAGETTMKPELVGSLDLCQRSDSSVYVECYKA